MWTNKEESTVVAIPMARDMFSKVDKLLCLYLTIFVTTCAAEEFVSLPYQSHLRSTMTEEHLIHTKKKQIPLYLTEVARLFVSANKRRTDSFGKY